MPIPPKRLVAVAENIRCSAERAPPLSNIDLSGQQNRLLRELKAASKTVITVLVNGRPMAVTEAAKNSDALCRALERGKRAGNACADLLLGKQVRQDD